jgi:hypothetical protein
MSFLEILAKLWPFGMTSHAIDLPGQLERVSFPVPNPKVIAHEEVPNFYLLALSCLAFRETEARRNALAVDPQVRTTQIYRSARVSLSGSKVGIGVIDR